MGDSKRGRPKQDLESRFMKYVEKMADGCWLWIGAKFKYSGLGAFCVEKKTRYAHRISFEIFNGPIPTGKDVVRTCSNKFCINPEHLSAGSQYD
jgi:hypothetical protein